MDTDRDLEDSYAASDRVRSDVKARRVALIALKEALSATCPAEPLVSRKVLEDLARAISRVFWTSDNGNEMRNGTADDGEAPEELLGPWKAAEEELDHTSGRAG